MQNYTYSFLFFFFFSFCLSGCLDAKTSSYSLYNNCNEYYDSRGFYHKKCDNPTINKQQIKKAIKTLEEEVDPNNGLKKKKSVKSKLEATIDDIIKETTSNEPTKKEDNKSKPLTPSIFEKPDLEFGRESR